MTFTTIVLASALLVQTVYGQCLGNLVQQSPVAVNYAPSVNLAPNVNYAAQGLNLVSNGLQVPGCSYASNVGIANGNYVQASPIQQQLEALSIASGSYASPGSISVYGENLSIGGEVNIAGSVPFLGTVAVSGAVPTSGQAQVSYNSASGVGLTSGGCGQGVSGGAVYGNGLGLNNVEVSNIGLVGLNGYNGLNVVNNGVNVGYNGLSNVGYNGLSNVGYNGLSNVGLVGNNLVGQSSCGCGY